MGANYDMILIPAVEREALFKTLEDALAQLGQVVVHREEPEIYDGFHHRSVKIIFVGPQSACRWLPISATGCGLWRSVSEWCLANPLARSLSRILSPVVYLFSYDSGAEAGYSIFVDGERAESQSVGRHPAVHLGEQPPSPPTTPGSALLGELLNEPGFGYQDFMDGFKKGSYKNLEVATAAFAARLGVSPHLLEPYGIDDGDGGIVVENGEYEYVSLDGWMAVYYDTARVEGSSELSANKG